MATNLAPKPVGNEPDGTGRAVPAPATTATAGERSVVDLTELHRRSASEADEAVDLHGAELVEVELPRHVGIERISTRMVLTGVAVMMVVVLAPLLVLLAVQAVPTTEQLQGALLVAGWIALAAGSRWIDTRRTPPRGGRDR